VNALARLPEPVAIIFVAVLVAGNIIVLPATLSRGAFILSLSCIFLFQTLIRDIWILSKTSKSDQSVRKLVFCLETTFGILGVIFGLIVYLNTANGVLQVSSGEWAFAVFLTMGLCYLIKDLVISWRPFRIYRDPDHINIVVSLK
jgi:hypothetical protein